GTQPRLRWKLLRERVLAMQRIWSDDEAEYHGQLVNFDPLWSWPKPVQRPHPPIILGGNGAGLFPRIVEYGDGWMPILGRPGVFTTVSHETLPARAQELQRLAAAAGRSPIEITVYGVPADPAVIERFAAAGVTRCLFALPSAPAAVVLPRLEEQAK